MSSVAPSLRWLSRRSLVLAAGLLSTAAWAQDNEKLTYDDHIRPLLENKCFSCHNPDKKKGGLELTSYSGLMSGGSGGAVVDAGNPQGSRLWTCSAKKEEPFMPPEGAPLDAKDLALLSKWIAGGVLQAKGSVAKKSNKPKVDLSFAGGAGKPTGPVARPENVLLEPVIVTPRTSAVIAMAARSRSCSTIPTLMSSPASCLTPRATPARSSSAPTARCSSWAEVAAARSATPSSGT
jgi:hypothetical protein